MHPEWPSILRHRVGLSGVGGFILGFLRKVGVWTGARGKRKMDRIRVRATEWTCYPTATVVRKTGTPDVPPRMSEGTTSLAHVCVAVEGIQVSRANNWVSP